MNNRLQILIGVLFTEIFVLVIILVGAHKFLLGRASVSASVWVVNKTPVVDDLKICNTSNEKCTNLQHLALTAGSGTDFYAVGHMSDENGFDDIVDLQLRFYRTSLGHDCDLQAGSCLEANLSSKTCELRAASATTGIFICRFSLPPWTDPTWGVRATYQNDSWTARASVVDTSRAGAWNEARYQVNALLSISADKEIALPSNASTATMKVVNTGNIESEALVSIDSLRCDGSQVPVAALRVDSTATMKPSSDQAIASDQLHFNLDRSQAGAGDCVANLTITAY